MPQTVGPQCARILSGAFLLGLLAGCGGSSEPPAVATVAVSPTSASPRVGQTVQLSATVKDAGGNVLSGQSVSWSSSAAGVASVSNSGLVTANALGTAMITAASGNKSGVATITVIPEPIASITLSKTNDTLLVAETLQLNATLRDENDNVVTRPITWTSSNGSVASVSGSGLVTGVGDGIATITATAGGMSASATITVFGPCSIALAPPITVGQTINGTLASTDCRLSDGTYTDGYAIQVTTATNVQIDMTASYDTYLLLLELTPADTLALSAENDDIDPANTNSRINFTLQPGVPYFILANTFDANVFGDYQLSVVQASFVAGAAVTGKPGKAPAASLLKALRPPR
ncbi:MAG TPA: Ig-like domain-containing protein [Gemmatimonadaceae bacterium]